ncbi:MAG: transposase, partial [Okeania sp. SIO4D6]|nr:transposase [Okeania sp. SIO4D6]
ITDKWLYFLKSANSLDSVPEKMREVPEIHKAFEVANQAGLTRE